MDKGLIANMNEIYHTKEKTEETISIAKELALDIVLHTTKRDKNRNVRSRDKRAIWLGSEAVPYKTLRRTVEEITARHEIVYSSIVKKLDLTSDNLEQVFINVVNEIFKDKHYNWGRVVSVYAFGARLAQYALENNICESDIEFIGEFVGKYVSEKLIWWIEANGGWSAFEEYFPEPIETKIEQNIWKGLLCTAGVGLAALAAVVVVR